MTSSHRWRAPFPAVALLLASLSGLAACSQDVAAPQAVRGVVIATSTPSFAVNPGEQATVTVHVTRLGFADPVTLAVLDAPPGVIVNLPSDPVSGDSAVFAVHVGTVVPPGSYRLRLTASGAGIPTDAITLTLEVLAPSAVAITVPYCAAAAPIWVAFQDGGGKWTRAAAVPSGGQTLFRYSFTSARGAIATVSPAGDGLTVLRVLYGSPAELATEGDTLGLACQGGAAKEWHGRVDGLATADRALVSTGRLRGASVLSSQNEFQLFGIPAGPQDVLVTRWTLQDGTAMPTGLILRRDLDLPDGAELPAFDFNSAEVFAPATARLTIVGAGSGGVASFSELHTRNSMLTVPFLTGQPSAATRPYVGLPVSRLQPGDLQLLNLSTDGSEGPARTAAVYFRSTTDRTVRFGAPVPPPAVRVEGTSGPLRVSGTYERHFDYEQSASLVLWQSTSSAIVSITMSEPHIGDEIGALALVVPDLSLVDGFNSAWALQRGSNVFWSATRVGGTVPFGRNALPTDGSVRFTAVASGVLGT